jgi:hypothetical protein
LPGLVRLAVDVRSRSRLNITLPSRRTGGRPMQKRQGNLAREPLIAPIKTHLTPELASNYFFHDARTEPAVRGPLDGWPA